MAAGGLTLSLQDGLPVAVPPGLSFHYAVAGIARPEQWEVGTGRIGSDGRLLREVVAASSNDGTAVDFTPGLTTIALTVGAGWFAASATQAATLASGRSEEHTSELTSLMRTSYAGL